MEYATRGKVSKIEAGLVYVTDCDMMFISRALRVELSDLQEPSLRQARSIYDAMAALKKVRQKRGPK